MNNYLSTVSSQICFLGGGLFQKWASRKGTGYQFLQGFHLSNFHLICHQTMLLNAGLLHLKRQKQSIIKIYTCNIILTTHKHIYISRSYCCTHMKSLGKVIIPADHLQHHQNLGKLKELKWRDIGRLFFVCNILSEVT